MEKDKKEEPLQLGLKVIFIDKDFKYSWAIEYRASDIERYQKMKTKLFERIWAQIMENGITGVLKNFPKNWKSYEQYSKKFQQVMNAKVKENEKRAKQGKKLMSKKEWNKGIPIFLPRIKPDDVRAIVIGKNCWVRVFVAANLTTKVFQKIINDYKI
jgi:hypothetical protein